MEPVEGSESAAAGGVVPLFAKFVCRPGTMKNKQRTSGFLFVCLFVCFVFFYSAQFEETSIIWSLGFKNRKLSSHSARTRRNYAADKGGMSPVRADKGAELKRAEPCDHAKGEPLMCHINPRCACFGLGSHNDVECDG